MKRLALLSTLLLVSCSSPQPATPEPRTSHQNPELYEAMRKVSERELRGEEATPEEWSEAIRLHDEDRKSRERGGSR